MPLAIVNNICCRGKREEFYCFLHCRIFGATCTRFAGEVKRRDFQQEKIKTCHPKVGTGSIGLYT